jgi:hypothetical protein
LTVEDCAKICLDAGREYLDACASVGSQNLLLAEACFNLAATVRGTRKPQESGYGLDEVAKELKLLEALPLLASYGVQLLPVQGTSRL